MRIVFILYLLFFYIRPAYPLNLIDSLENLLVASQGKDRLDVLGKLSRIYRTENPSKSIIFGEAYLELSREIGDKHDEISALNSLGITCYQLGYYETTLDYFIRSLQVSEFIADDIEIARALNNLGNIFDEIGDKEKAISYYKRSLQLKEKVDDKRGLANTLSNIGYIYNELNDTKQAYKYFIEALNIDEEEGNIEGVFASCNNLGLCFFKMSAFDSALFYFNRALSLESKIDNLYDKAEFFNSLGNIYGATDKLQNAIENYNKSLSLSQSIKARSLIRDSYKGLAEVHSLSNNLSLAFDYIKRYTMINDSLHNETNSRRIAGIESDYKMQKREQEIQLLVKESEIQSLILTKNKHISYFLYAGLFLLVGLILVFFQKYQFKAKANYLLKVQNNLIETKNSNITDSINYAKGIQEAILPDLGILENAFKEHFIICKPRDIVNGDFYWFADKEDYFILAVVDCTGHGVPGAFMHVLSNSLLNQIINDQNILNPPQILNELNKRVLAMLHQESFNKNNYGGMDIGIVLYHKYSGKLVFSGAKHALYVFKHNKHNKLEVIKGNKISLGGNYKQDRYFDEHESSLAAGDSFYLFTDGIIDQFGEKSNKKFMSQQLKEMLIAVNHFPMSEQARVIEDRIMEWKGKCEQTDDILMIGIKI